ncbi:MAG: phosphomannomutase/phosphoglucomutase [Polyangia bacterium]
MAGIFKAYDIRGTYPDQINEPLAAGIGAAAVDVLGARSLVVGRDMRQSGSSLSSSLIEAVLARGCDVFDIGQCDTPMSYWAVNTLGTDGAIMITASHNPARYNGCKISGKGAAPVSYDTGIGEIERRVAAQGSAGPNATGAAGSAGTANGGATRGRLKQVDIQADYHRWLLSQIPAGASIKPFSLVIDTGNGMMGGMLPGLLAQLPCQVTPLFFEVDGSFPNHEPNPLDPRNMRDLQAKVREVKADLGIAFDGDGDRVMFVDERGEIIPSDRITALLAGEFLRRAPGSTVIYDLRSSWVVRDEILRLGGKPLESRVGHSFIKQNMRATDAVFAGELSGHFYFRDAFFTDNGELAMLHVLAVLGQRGGRVSEIMAPFDRYFATGEINFEVEDKDACIQRLVAAFPDAELARLDGITLRFSDWWCNVRASNTEPVLRLNLEARTPELRDEKRARVESLIGGHRAAGH